ncbi:pilus assembly protein TadG-related protein [Aquihabitans daechungensis]|uniref:pilus assembly protein TadG-related protein n=1 Tax=Aquihabitans daechungensis TaxID=1052257 RepID=UPI003BA39F74
MLLNHQPVARRALARSQGEHGYIMVMFALLLVPLLLMAGLAVDVGKWYSRSSDMRRAADAAALAGVVWLPDENAARTAALAAAARNGFVPSSTVTITVTPSSQSERRLKVTIRDTKVGSFFYSSLGGKDLDLRRTSFAEYVLAVPMGSPRNFFGTGTLLASYTATGIPAEYLYQSVNPYCTDKENGDRYQSGYNGDTCAGTANSEYRTSGYSMYIEAPEGRRAPIDVKLYDARYSEAAVSYQVQGTDSCVGPFEPRSWSPNSTSTSSITVYGPVQYQTRSDPNGSYSTTTNTLVAGQSYSRRADLIRYQYPNVLNWTAGTDPNTWTTSTSNTNVTLTAPAEYQTRSSAGGSWSSTVVTLNGDRTYTRNRQLIRYRTGTYQTGQICTPTYTTASEGAIDDYRQSGGDNYTYTLYAADNTPLNDEDNPQICQQTFTPTTAHDGTVYLGSRRWNTLCSIDTTQPSGRYILRVTNSGAVSDPENDGSNQWGSSPSTPRPVTGCATDGTTRCAPACTARTRSPCVRRRRRRWHRSTSPRSRRSTAARSSSSSSSTRARAASPSRS